MSRAGKVPLGSFVASLDPATTHILGTVGFDFVILDGEHGPIDKIHALAHIRAAHAAGTIPLARVLENSAPLIQSFLDIGAQGLVVPHIDTADDAKRMVAAGQYGAGRGMCPICHAADYALEQWSEFVTTSNDNVLMIPLIESGRAMDNLAEIVATPGIEVVMFGPGDLSQDIGIDILADRPKVIELWNKFRTTVHAAGKLTLAPNGLGLEGSDILTEFADLVFLRNAAVEALKAHRSEQA